MPEPGVVVALALAAGVVGQVLARHLRLPGIVVLLALGAVLGPDGLGWVQPSVLGHALFSIINFGVAVIVFEGGLNLELSRLRREERPIRRLITAGAAVTLIGGAGAAALLLRWPWQLSLLFGSLVVVTGPTVVTPLLRELRLRPRVRTILEAEGVLIDPIGAVLAVAMVSIALVPAGETVASGAAYIASTLAMGSVAGVLGGLAIGGVLRSRVVVPAGLENVFTLAMVWMLFHGCDLALEHSGLLAVTIAGIIVGNMETPVDRDLREFKDQLTVMLVGALFILLAANTRIDSVTALGWRGVFVVVVLMVVVRPIGAWLATAGSGLAVEERLFIAWLAPRGIVAAAVSSLAGLSLAEAGLDGGPQLSALVFLTIVVTVLVGGLTAAPLATWLGIRLPDRDRIAILGANGLGLALGAALREENATVVFLDSDPRRCRRAEDQGFQVIFGDGLQERTMARAQMELVGTVVGVTANEHVNSLFAASARTLFSVPLACVAIDFATATEHPDHLRLQDADVLFDGPVDAERWDVRFRHGEAEVARFTFEEAPLPAKAEVGSEEGAPTAEALRARAQEPFLILTLRQGKHVGPMRRTLTPRTGDIAAIAFEGRRADEVVTMLESRGWHRLPAEVPEPGTDSREGAARANRDAVTGTTPQA